MPEGRRAGHLRYARPNLYELLRVLEKIHDLLQFIFFLFGAGDVGKGDLLLFIDAQAGARSRTSLRCWLRRRLHAAAVEEKYQSRMSITAIIRYGTNIIHHGARIPRGSSDGGWCPNQLFADSVAEIFENTDRIGMVY